MIIIIKHKNIEKENIYKYFADCWQYTVKWKIGQRSQLNFANWPMMEWFLRFVPNRDIGTAGVWREPATTKRPCLQWKDSWGRPVIQSCMRKPFNLSKQRRLSSSVTSEKRALGFQSPSVMFIPFLTIPGPLFTMVPYMTATG